MHIESLMMNSYSEKMVSGRYRMELSFLFAEVGGNFA